MVERELNDSNQFRKDVLKAKAKYRKVRKLAILTFMSCVLLVSLIRIYFYTQEKKTLQENLAAQEEKIKNLDNENRVNGVVIDKLKDPYFLTDLVRQEYGVGYEGEIIFNLPLKNKFMETTIKSIMEGNIQKSDDNTKKIDEEKIKELLKKDSKTTESSNKKEGEGTSDTKEDDKKSSSSEENKKTTNENKKKNN